MKNYLNDFITLAKYSDMAEEMIKSDKNVYVTEVKSTILDSDFHPNGKCGCIELNDEYFLGIRCDHLMWTEFWTENDFNIILVYGNHKGNLTCKCIMTYEGEDDIVLDNDNLEYVLEK